jgi:hypothetical protein
MSLPLLLPALATRYSLLLPDGFSSCLVGHLGCGGGRSGVDVGRTEKDTFSLILSEFQLCWVSAKGAAVRMWETEALRVEGIYLRSTVRVRVGTPTWLPSVSSETDSCEQSGTVTCGEQQPIC